MYLHHNTETVHKLRYFSPDTKPFTDTVLSHDSLPDTDSRGVDGNQKNVKPFLTPDDDAFAKIRNKLSTLTLSTDYSHGMDATLISPPFQRDKKLPPRRISSISSRDTYERRNEGSLLTKPRIHSRSSFLSDDKELRQSKKNFSLHRNRASETEALNKLNENILTPGQNPELFARQIRTREKTEKSGGKSVSSRCSSPKSARSVDSSGKVHLGLIESLDLNENLHDVEKIKERYSNNTFMHSLMLYKQRGHDKCIRHDGCSHLVRTGTRLHSPEPMRSGSKYSAESQYAITSVISPRLSAKLFPHLKKQNDWEPDQSHVHNQLEAEQNPAANRNNGRKTPRKRKKSVGFDMEPKELNPRDSEESLTIQRKESAGTEKELKSILKRTNSLSVEIDLKKLEEKNHEDEFVVNESYLWKYHLPKIHSPAHNQRGKLPTSFRRKMYHFGDGVSSEFQQVITKYGNCRQGSWIREHSFVRDQSFTSQA